MNDSGFVIDCSKLKHPNTGLYSFCLHLINAMMEHALKKDMSFTTFLSHNCKNIFPVEVYPLYMTYINRYYLYLPQKYKVWHAVYQLSPYIPISRQKKVITVHDLNFLYEKGQKHKKKSLSILQKNINQADRIVAISEYTKKDLLTHIDVRNKPVDVIYNGCNIYRGEIKQPLQLPTRPFLFSLGTLLEKKNFHVLPCLLKHNEYELIIAGNHSAYAAKIIEEAHKWGVEGRVHIVGAVNEKEKQWYLQKCEAFLFPSIAEGFGLPVVEAMAYGKPVFLSSHTSLPEIGGEVATYFNKEFDREEMQKEFIKGMNVYKNNNLEEQIKKQAFTFSWEKAAKEYWNIYETLKEGL